MYIQYVIKGGACGCGQAVDMLLLSLALLLFDIDFVVCVSSLL